MYRLKKIFSFLLALFILVSGTNIVFSAHLCAGEISDISLFKAKTESCCCKAGETDKESHSPENQTYIKTLVCCSDRFYSEKGIDLVYPFSREREVKVYLPVLLIPHDVNSLLSEIFGKQRNHFLQFTYLPDCRDITVLVQSFLL